MLPFWNPGEEGARHEACLKIAESGSKVAKFACRATGTDVGKWRAEGGGSRSDLADPYAEPGEILHRMSVADSHPKQNECSEGDLFQPLPLCTEWGKIRHHLCRSKISLTLCPDSSGPMNVQTPALLTTLRLR